MQRRLDPAERELGLFQAIFEEVRYKELKHMAQSQYAVRPEGYEELHKWFLQSCTVEERLEGISVEERLRGLPAEEVLRRVPVEERLRGLTPEQRAQLLALLQREPRN